MWAVLQAAKRLLGMGWLGDLDRVSVPAIVQKAKNAGFIRIPVVV